MTTCQARSIPSVVIHAELPTALRVAIRETNRDFAKFLVIAIASSSELEYHLQFSGDANLIPRHECDARLTDVVQVRRMLIGLLKRVRSSDGPVAVVPPPTTGDP